MERLMRFTTLNHEKLLKDCLEDEEEVFIILKMFYKTNLDKRVTALYKALMAQKSKEITVALLWIEENFSYIYAEKIFKIAFEDL